MTGRDAEREQLAAAFAGVDCDPALDSRDVDELLDALLPVVDRIANERAAAEVETVRQWLLETGRADADTLWQIRDRTDQIARAALRASNGAGTAT